MPLAAEVNVISLLCGLLIAPQQHAVRDQEAVTERVLIVAKPKELELAIKDIPADEKPPVADRLLMRLGYSRYKEGGDVYFISTTIWPKKFFEESIAGLKALPNAINENGSIDQSRSPAIRQLCKGIFDQSVGVSTTPQSRPGIESDNWVQMSDGRRTVSVRVSGRNHDREKQVAAMKADGGGKLIDPKDLPSFRGLPGQVPLLDNHFEVKLFALNPNSVITKTKMTSKAFALVSEAYADYQAKLDKIWPDLFQQLSKLGLADRINGLEKGTFASQPQDVRDRLSAALGDSASAYGFSGADDARDFLSHATITGFGKGLTFTAWVNANNQFGGYGYGARMSLPYIGP